jgi:hypothetical protein
LIDALAAPGRCLIIEDQIQEPPDGRRGGSQRVAKR